MLRAVVCLPPGFKRQTIYHISAVLVQHIKSVALLQLVTFWLHVSAVTRPSSGQQGIVLLRYIQLVFPMGSHCLMLLRYIQLVFRMGSHVTSCNNAADFICCVTTALI